MSQDAAHARLCRRYHFACAEQARKLADEAERSGMHDSAKAIRECEASHRRMAELCSEAERSTCSKR